jgi:small subunit ribosomal protein S20
MAITKSAKRGIRVSERKALVNAKRTRVMKDTVKTLRKSVASGKGQTQEELRLAFKALDKAAKGGIIKKGTADRKKSRLAKAVAKISK